MSTSILLIFIIIDMQILKETEGKGVNVLIDFVGKDYWFKNMEVMGLDGHWVILAFMSGKIRLTGQLDLVTYLFLIGTIIDKVDISPLLRKRVRVSDIFQRKKNGNDRLNILMQIEGSNLRARTVEYQAKLRDAIYSHAVENHFAKKDGVLKVYVDKVFNWEDIIDAHKYLESNKSMGKIVVKVTPNQ